MEHMRGIDNGKHEHRRMKGFVTVLQKGNVNFFLVKMCLIDNERLRPANNNSHSAHMRYNRGLFLFTNE